MRVRRHPAHIAGIIEREHVAATADRLLPRRTLLVEWKRKRGGDVFRSWITDLPVRPTHSCRPS